ncbi:MarR family winged helix-turn-helix transcriptional regulator [Furfurilactobacillus siliginis]|uniref:HTH marR-type domain-containing protein n=1 Tax=Furfurilactobacillus siliginis TaxID=348151 RepID=A0A0R2L8E9_9LACO|nr:MarR family winged helix-turn-helix transcriptional regulator [Furfurilactobacillus siliginis]KRN96038.1 hypothetical protein IV55_GL001719 [Furfurilactobacillus siliginis]GEK29272.1 hypothetical protein LSI01_15830 [Furfurilactobacillus siliginis]
MSEINFAECLYFSSGRINRIIAKISDQQFNQLGLSSTAAFMLMYLDSDTDINPSAIADELSLDRSTVTRFLDKLEHAGYITRTVNGRNVTVTLTDDGKALQPRLMTMWSDLNEHYQTILGKAGEQQLRELLNQDFETIR